MLGPKSEDAIINQLAIERLEQDYSNNKNTSDVIKNKIGVLQNAIKFSEFQQPS